MKKWIKAFFGEEEPEKQEQHSKNTQEDATTKPKHVLEPMDKTQTTTDYTEMSVEEAQYMFASLVLDDDVAPTGENQPKEVIKPKSEAPLKDKPKTKSEAQPKAVVQTASATQPNVATQPNGAVNTNGVTKPNGGVPPTSATQSGGVFVPNGANQPIFGKVFTPKVLEVNTRLTIFLVENSEEVAVEEENLEMVAKKLATIGHVYVINYGSVVRESKILDAKDFKPSNLIYDEFVGDNACLFDALVALKGVVDKYYKKSEEIKGKKFKINGIDIIGIGRCVDNCSIASRKRAIESFSKIAKYIDVTTKYFCIDEEDFVGAATIGFHSIGGFARNYK